MTLKSGAGKTNMGYLILDQLQQHKKPFLVFDWKRNYRDLIAKPGFDDLEIYTIGRPFAPLSFNPLIPPKGIPPKTWLKKIIEVIAHAYMLGNGVLYMLQQYSARFSFEIWKDDAFSFHFFSSAKSVEGMIKGQLSSVYPQVVVKRSKTSIPLFKDGDYVSSCSLVLQGVELNLKRPGDFRYDPLRHILEAMNGHDSKMIVQILFERLRRIPKDKRIALTQKFGDDLFFRNVGVPILKCLVRITAVSKDGFKARESREHVARTFSVFDSDKCRLSPKIVSYPVFRNSLSILASVNLREFPIFSKQFMVSLPELASIVHLPVGAENCGVEYSESSLTPSNLPW